jgi:PUA domain protein
MSLRIRRRTRLRRKEASALLARLASEFGVESPPEDAAIDEADAGDLRLLLLGPEPFAFLVGDAVAPTVRSLLAKPASRRHVTVDMGAVPHVYNGADVMAPGIVDADPGIAPGDIVWVRDERFGRPLAIGRALMDGPAMVRERKGKAIETLHHVGDDLWSLAEEAP